MSRDNWLPSGHVGAEVMATADQIERVLLLVAHNGHDVSDRWASYVSTDVDNVAQITLFTNFDRRSGKPEVPFLVPIDHKLAASMIAAWFRELERDQFPMSPDNDGDVKPCAVHMTTSRTTRSLVLIQPAWGIWGK